MSIGVAAERVPCVTSGSLNQLGRDNEIHFPAPINSAES
jgi:hypothetical protein